MSEIIIKGARENNLKNINLTIPRDKFVVFTGVSGSGKSSLAFDTLYAEGQRRYVESLSAYARQFLGQMDKPDVDSIDGLSPAISIDQKSTSHNPRSTVGTVTEIYDYLRLLYARTGIPHCPKCGKVIERQSIDQIVDSIMGLPENSRLQLLAPVVRERKGEHVKLLDDARKQGFVRVRVNGEIMGLEEEINLDRQKWHTIEIVVDRLIVKKGIESRLSESIEMVAHLTGGIITVDVDGKRDLTFSQHFACPDCGINLEEIEPRLFSFNNPAGACPDCTGLGFQMEFDPDLIVPNDKLSILEGAIHVMGWLSIADPKSSAHNIVQLLSKDYGLDLQKPFGELSKKEKDLIFYGNGKETGIAMSIPFERQGKKSYYDYTFKGIIPMLDRRADETNSSGAQRDYEKLMTNHICKTCHGKKLKPEVLAVTVNQKSISDVTEMTIKDMQDFFANVKQTETEKLIGEQILKEIHARTGFLLNVGLDYLTLSRAAATLSGGEAQRIRLATQIGSGLVGVVYILDEPSIGLHQRDNNKLLLALKELKDLGNTLIVVEHDTDTMLASDFIVDIGPMAGNHGGEIVYAGPIEGLLKNKDSITSAYLTGAKKIVTPSQRRKSNGQKISIRKASENNLKNINVDFPLGVFTCVTGVSGSGKSSLVNEILYKRLARDLNRAKFKAGSHKSLTGQGYLDKIINIDQSPIGRTPRSNPATYTGLFDMVRDVFAETTEAKIRGYQRGRFSFNVKGGRCEACRGDGIIQIEMNFLPDVYVPCEVCQGKRYNRETLEVKYKGASIYDVLDMTIEVASEFFANLPRLQSKLQTMMDVGLGYIKLGQSSTTLSGGEAQRVKLSTELSKRSTGQTLFVLDEPTTGLHAYDVHRLVNILERLTDEGNTVVVIEHNLDVIKMADHIIDLGPEGGDKGGYIVGTGTPEAIAKIKKSYTGQFLKEVL